MKKYKQKYHFLKLHFMRKLFYLMTALFFFVCANAQERKITGKVINQQTNESVGGATISVKGTNTATQSATDGSFTITVPSARSTLVVSFVGMEQREYAIGNQSNILMELKSTDASMNEVVVTGYRRERKKDLTGAIAVVDVDDMRKQNTANPIKGLQGQVAGVYITTNGNPNSPATVRIRGVGTLNNNNPLFIIDGVPTRTNIQELNPADIESMQVLKDAASATIYGARAANGVIIITTKQGKAGRLSVTANATTSVSHYTTKPPLLDADGYGTSYWRASVNSGRDPNVNNIAYRFDWNVDANGVPHLNKIILPEYLDVAKTLKTANTDWFDEVSRTGLIQSYDLTLSNGTDKGNYLFSFGYFDNSGVVKTTDYSRLSGRINSSYKLFNNKVVIGENFTLNRIREVADQGVLNLALQAMPIVPVHTVDGVGWGGPVGGMNDRQNPVRLLEDNKQNVGYGLRLFGNVYGNVTLLKGLVFNSNFGIDYSTGYKSTFLKTYQSGYLVGTTNRLTLNQSEGSRVNWSNTLNYTKTKLKHSLSLLAGTEFYKQRDNSFFASRDVFAIQDPNYTYLDAGSGSKDDGGNAAENALMSYFGQADYGFDNKYLASFKIRRDGSSRFGENNRFGTFPAAAVAWRISEEPFFTKLISPSIVNDLKLRASWGQMGSQESDNNAIYTYYITDYTGGNPLSGPTIGTAYDLTGANTGTLPSGYRRVQKGNNNLKWETTTMTNYGIDFTLFNQRLRGSAEYYIKETDDILVLPPALAATGEGGRQWMNGASMENKGFEFTLINSGKIGQVNYELNGNFSTYKNKVTYLPSSVVNSYGGNGTTDNILGRPLNSFYGYVADGLFRTQKEVDDYATQVGKGLGRIRFVDLNGDKVVNTVDRTWIGDPNPKFFYGLNVALDYKGFDVSAFFQGVSGNAVQNEVKYNTDFWSVAQTGSNKGTRTLQAWTPQNPNSNIPALTQVDANNEARLSTYFIEKGSYFKLRNMQLGYTLSSSLLSRAKMQKARIYIGGDNLLLIAKSKTFTGLDPENPAFGYPNPKVFTAGVMIGL
jgi:TonB-linked SusC/RagA family outer membrane protein